jgi:hypothetical protein
MKRQKLGVAVEFIDRRIYLIRGQKVMLDHDLAEIYGVETRALVQGVKRNIDRFPPDFMFKLSATEASALRSQYVILENGRGRYPKYAPHAFTELGVAMLSSVLNSKRAIQMNIVIMRTFVKLREMLATQADLARAIDDLRRRQEEHGQQITSIFETINELLLPEPVPPKRRIGFNPKAESPAKHDILEKPRANARAI